SLALPRGPFGPVASRRYNQAGVSDRLYCTDSDEADELIASDQLALLIGFALGQEETIQWYFVGPLGLRLRLFALDASTIANVAPPPPALVDVDSPQAVLYYRAAKRAHKAQWR